MIDHIFSWSEEQVAKSSCISLYQNYVEWCGGNGKKLFSNNILDKKFSRINIKCKRASSEKRKWQYILDRSKIIAKIRETVGNIKEFFDIPQPDLPKNETADIPIFNMPEIILQKIISPQPIKNTSSPSTSKDKKADKQDDSTQILFDYMVEKTEAPVTSTSETFKTTKASEPSKPVIDKPETSKPPKPIEHISNVLKAPKSSNNKILFTRTWREERLRK